MEVFCSHCSGVKMDLKKQNETYIYVCPECPNITFEYTTEKDLNNLKEYLDNQK